MQNNFTSTGQYIASEELMMSVNIAMALEKPLLIKGEPGTGKTMLAKAVSEALGKKLIVWNIKSTTKAQEGLYTYDTIQRLYDSEDQVVLLIDEIDKADLEFPNDLLWELDQMEFYIYETKRTVKAVKRPIVIITSNAEKELPDAFLRRCIFHYIDFPDRELMEEIVKTHIPDIEENLLKNAMDTFYEIRTYSQLRKKPATSELIDWLNALIIAGVDPEKIKRELPFVGVLIKKDEDLEVLRKRVD